MIRKVFITGGAGFIGSNLTERLLSIGCEVTVFDNLSLGKKKFIKKFFDHKKFRFILGDISDLRSLKKFVPGTDTLFHLAANSDIRRGMKDTKLDFEIGILGTYNVLEAARDGGVSLFVFASSSVVYGDIGTVLADENFAPLLPTSLYGAAKLSGEALVSAYAKNFHMMAYIYRFANIVGKNGTHGAIVDFIRKLKKNDKVLKILGDGNQRKPYLHVSECIDGMLFGLEHSFDNVNLFNLTPSDTVSVKEIAGIVVEEMGLRKTVFEFEDKPYGWPGDIPQVRLDGSAMKKSGWAPAMNSKEAVTLAVKELLCKL